MPTMRKRRQAPKAPDAPKPETTYTKAQLLQSKRFADRKDALGVVMQHDERLTIAQTQERLDQFLKGVT